MSDEANNSGTNGASAEENTDGASVSSWQTQSQTSSSSPGEGTVSLKDQTVQTGHELLEKGKETAGLAIDRAKSQIVSKLSDQKDRASDTLTSATEALAGASQHFRDQNLDLVADYAESFGGQVRKVSEYLREKDLDELSRDVSTFAKNNPAVFIGGAFLLGVAIARFLRSSGSGAPMQAISPPNNALTASSAGM